MSLFGNSVIRRQPEQSSLPYFLIIGTLINNGHFEQVRFINSGYFGKLFNNGHERQIKNFNSLINGKSTNFVQWEHISASNPLIIGIFIKA